MATAKERAKPAGGDDPRDILYVPGTLEVPSSVLPDTRRVRILDQGQTGASTGFALAAVLNYLRAAGGEVEPVSGQALYEYARLNDEWAGQPHEGSSLRGALRGVSRQGAPLERDLPAGAGPKFELSREARERALANRPASYERVQPNIEHLKAALHEQKVLYAGANVHAGWFSAEGGVIRRSKSKDEGSPGAHAFAIIGYVEEGFIVQNSWGTTWGGAPLPGSTLPGCAIWPFDDAADNLMDAWILRMAAEVSARVLAGYAPDSIEGPDLLEIRREAQAFSFVLAAKEVDPPLAIGLFGEWGGGKSFFMETMQQEIFGVVERAKSARGTSPFCTQVVPIRFNAWHYLDTDLWASLVTEVFDRLFEHIAPSADISEALKKELQKAQGLFQQAERELSDAKQARNQAETALKNAIEERGKQERELATQLDDVVALLSEDQGVLTQLNQLSESIGAKELAKSFDAVDEQVGELKSVTGRLGMVFRATVGSPAGYRRLFVLAAVMLLPIGIAIVFEWLNRTKHLQIAEVHAQFSEWSALLAGVAGWLGVQVKQGAGVVGKLERIHETLEKRRKERLEKGTASQQRALAAAREREEAARKSLQEAELRVQAIELELAEQQPGRRIYRFIEERAKSAEYRSRLGIVSLVRRDFEHLSRLFQAGKKDESIKAIMPVERIILYIDDLDRCKPDRVIEVLEAVHLLLAFPLFMVVVAVDPRWLRRCLEQYYPDLLAARTQQPNVLANVLPSRPATAQDYLEKIFQVPFTLQPLRGDGYRKLLRGLAAPKVASHTETRELAAMPGQGQVAAAPQPPAPAPADEAAGKTPGVAQAPAPAAPAPAPPVSIEEAVERLAISEWELFDLQRLSPLFRTPRTVKRFFNTYRFLRAGLSPAERNAFVGTKDAPGHYQVVIVLLAVVVSYPNVAPAFMQQVLDVADRTPRPKDWQHFLKALGKELGVKPPATPKPRTKAQVHEDSQGAVPPTWENVEWKQLCAALVEVTDDSFPSAYLDDVISWVPRVARYSFSLSAQLLLPE